MRSNTSKSFINIAIVILSLPLLGACTSFNLQRSQESGYADSSFPNREISLRDLEPQQKYQERSPYPSLSRNPAQAYSASTPQRSVSSLIESGDISLGMNKEDVRSSWGDPDYIEVSGHSRFENERWRFTMPTQTLDGYRIEERVVYFEKGLVIGWTTR